MPKTWTFADFKKKRLFATGGLPARHRTGRQNEFHIIVTVSGVTARLQKKTLDLALLQEGQLVDAIDYMGIGTMPLSYASFNRFVKVITEALLLQLLGKRVSVSTPFHIFTMEQHEI